MAYEGVVIMGKKLDVLVADCSGNITIMVLSPVDRSDYKVVAQALLDNEAMGGEQVAFGRICTGFRYPVCRQRQ